MKISAPPQLVSLKSMVGLDKQADLQNIFKLIISCFILELIE